MQDPSHKKAAMKCQRAGRSSRLRSAWRFWRSLLSKVLLFFGLASMQPLTGLELTLSPVELEGLRSLLLGQLSEIDSLQKGLSERTLTIGSLERSLREQRELLARSEKQISSLQNRLSGSIGIAERLRQELSETRRLSTELQIAHEALSKSFASYRIEAQLQIRALRTERDREHARASLWMVVGGAALVAAGALLAVGLSGAR